SGPGSAWSTEYGVRQDFLDWRVFTCGASLSCRTPGSEGRPDPRRPYGSDLRIAIPHGDFQGEIVETDAGQHLDAVAGVAGGADGRQRNARAGFADAHGVVHAGVV